MNTRLERDWKASRLNNKTLNQSKNKASRHDKSKNICLIGAIFLLITSYLPFQKVISEILRKLLTAI